MIAQEILRTEIEYMEELGIAQKVFKAPLEAAFSSNRYTSQTRSGTLLKRTNH